MPHLINEMNPDELRSAVAEQYGRVVLQPGARHPFPVGYAFAQSLGYSTDLLNSLPRPAVDAFAGISYPLAYANLLPGEKVLDLGCGAGMDTILCARQVGPEGQVHSLDLSAAMLESARANTAAAGLTNVIFHLAPAEAIPVGDGQLDVVIVNGIFNLCPTKEEVMKEIYRTLRPGGRLFASEIVLADADDENWVGATCDLGSGRLSGLSLENWFQ